jgi:proline dehydrogenase
MNKKTLNWSDSKQTTVENPLNKQNNHHHSDIMRGVSRRGFSSLRFDDTKLVFGGKSTRELLRAGFVFWIAGFPVIVRNSKKLVAFSYRVFGSTITEAGFYLSSLFFFLFFFFCKALRATFFGHFCGGSDLESVAPTVRRLDSLGIGSILDYAAEKDVEEGKGKEGELSKETRSQGVVSARTFSYEGEESCEQNKLIFKECVDHVAISSPNAFAAIKVTALGRPELLRRISEVLVQTKRIFLKASERNVFFFNVVIC